MELEAFNPDCPFLTSVVSEDHGDYALGHFNLEEALTRADELALKPEVQEVSVFERTSDSDGAWPEQWDVRHVAKARPGLKPLFPAGLPQRKRPSELAEESP